jgi:hypothetical protein
MVENVHQSRVMSSLCPQPLRIDETCVKKDFGLEQSLPIKLKEQFMFPQGGIALCNSTLGTNWEVVPMRYRFHLMICS